MRFLLLLTVLICSSVQAQVCQTCGRVHGPKISSSLIAADGYPVVCRTDERAYQHALREAQILASQGRVYHPLGCAPGTSASGCGSSFDLNLPNHCYYRSGRRLVARARVMGRDGRFYFSAHYR